VHLAAASGRPITLRPEEAERFTQRIEAGAGPSALALLRALLATQREWRPRHALEISRALGRVGDAVRRERTLRSAA
jgi:serine/threonine-protein kinase